MLVEYTTNSVPWSFVLFYNKMLMINNFTGLNYDPGGGMQSSSKNIHGSNVRTLYSVLTKTKYNISRMMCRHLSPIPD